MGDSSLESQVELTEQNGACKTAARAVQASHSPQFCHCSSNNRTRCLQRGQKGVLPAARYARRSKMHAKLFGKIHQRVHGHWVHEHATPVPQETPERYQFCYRYWHGACNLPDTARLGDDKILSTLPREIPQISVAGDLQEEYELVVGTKNRDGKLDKNRDQRR